MADTNTSTQILDAATGLFLQYGYKRTTVDEIAAKVGIAKGSFYLHFPSKEAVFAAVSQRLAGKVLGEMSRIAASDLDVKTKLHRVLEDPILYIWDFCHRAPHAPALWSELLAAAGEFTGPAYACAEKIIGDIIAEGQAQGVFAGGLDVQMAARLFQLGTEGFDVPFRLIDDRHQIEKELPLLVDLLIRGLKHTPSFDASERARERS